MIPIFQLKDGRYINASQICRAVYHQENQTISVYYSDGITENYHGEDLKAFQVILNLNTQIFDQYLREIFEASRLVQPAAIG